MRMCLLKKLPTARKLKEIMVQSCAKIWPETYEKPMKKNEKNVYKSLCKMTEINTTIVEHLLVYVYGCYYA